MKTILSLSILFASLAANAQTKTWSGTINRIWANLSQSIFQLSRTNTTVTINNTNNAGNILTLQSNGVSQATIDRSGNIVTGGTVTANGVDLGGSLPQNYTVADEASRFALAGLHNGDTAKQVSTGTLWLLVDADKSADASGWGALGYAYFKIYYGGTIDPDDPGTMTDAEVEITPQPGNRVFVGGTPMTTLNVQDYLLDGTFTNLSVFAATLTSIILPGNSFTALDISGLTNLTELSMNVNSLTSLDTTDLISVLTIRIDSSPMTSFACSNCVSLTTLDASDGAMTTIDFTGMESLTTLEVQNSTNYGGGVFAAPNLTNLTTLNVSSSELTSFDGTGLSALTTLTITGNEPTMTNFVSGALLALNTLTIDNFTNLSALNIGGWSNVTGLSVTNAALTSGSVNNTLTNLDYFGLSGGTVALEGGTSATTNAAGSAAKVSLVGKGWTVTHN